MHPVVTDFDCFCEGSWWLASSQEWWLAQVGLGVTVILRRRCLSSETALVVRSQLSSSGICLEVLGGFEVPRIDRYRGAVRTLGESNNIHC